MMAKRRGASKRSTVREGKVTKRSGSKSGITIPVTDKDGKLVPVRTGRPTASSSTSRKMQNLPSMPSTSKSSATTLTQAFTSRIGSAPLIRNSLTSNTLRRLNKDLRELYLDPPHGIHVVQDECDMANIHVIITGPAKTPYDGGFFYFVFNCRDNYPAKPPKVRFMTTGGQKVRFNPNLYNSGHVCLSVLGTWGSSSWRPIQTLANLLVQIQSAVFNENPYYNEPGRRANNYASKRYNEKIQYETIRVAVIGMVNNDFKLNIPQALMDKIVNAFLQMYDKYEKLIVYKTRLSRKSAKHQDIQYAPLLNRLRELKLKLQPNPDLASPNCPGTNKTNE